MAWDVDETTTGVQTVRVSGPRPTTRQLARELGEVPVALALFATAPLVPHWHQRWGATDAEVAARMPGDDVVPDCQFVFTRAITIDAPSEVVWRWLVQVGLGKPGFYSNDLLDNAAHPSADRIIDELQHPQVGDWVPMFTMLNDVTAFKIAGVDPPESLLWVKPESTWSWKLIGGGGSSALIAVLLVELGDFPMIRKMLRGINQRAERHTESTAPGQQEPRDMLDLGPTTAVTTAAASRPDPSEPEPEPTARIGPVVVFYALVCAISWGWCLSLIAAGETVRRGHLWPTHSPALFAPAIARCGRHRVDRRPARPARPCRLCRALAVWSGRVGGCVQSARVPRGRARRRRGSWQSAERRRVCLVLRMAGGRDRGGCAGGAAEWLRGGTRLARFPAASTSNSVTARGVRRSSSPECGRAGITRSSS